MCRNCGGVGKGGTKGEPAVSNAKPGDWICTTCSELQFARNWACRNCGPGKGSFGKGGYGKGFKGDWTKGGWMKGSYGKGYGGFAWPAFSKGFGGKGAPRGGEVHGDPKLLVYVGNLKYEVKWQDLKDHMKQAGAVEYCRVLTEDGTDWGRSKGAGCVRYSTEEEVQEAIDTLAESELMGRKILVDRWAGGKGAGGKGAAGKGAGSKGDPEDNLSQSL